MYNYLKDKYQITFVVPRGNTKDNIIEKYKERFQIEFNSNTKFKYFDTAFQIKDHKIKNYISIFRLIIYSKFFYVTIYLTNDIPLPMLSHINIYMVQFPIKANTLIKKLLLYLQRIKRKRIYIANSDFTAGYIKDLYDIEPIIITPPIYFKENKIDIKELLKNKKNIILSVGRFTKEGHNKKQITLIKTFKKMNDLYPYTKKWKLVLIGAVKKEDTSYLNTLKKLAESYNIDIKQNMPIEEIIKFYKISKIYWHATGYGIDEKKYPEKMEHFGMTTIESMYFACIPIVINKGGQKEIINNNINGFMWDTEKELINKTLRIIKNYDIEVAINAQRDSNKYTIEEFNLKLNRLPIV